MNMNRKPDSSRRSLLATSVGSLAVVLSLLQYSGAGEVQITILHTNDLHQHVEPLPRIAGYVTAYRSKHPNTVFIDAGDWFDRGSSLVTLTQGEALYGTMATMGYDTWILGNHDWAYGGQRLFDLMMRYPVPVLGTNLATTQPALPSNIARTVIKEFDGIRVGFFGITLDTYGKNPKSRPFLYVLDCHEQTKEAVAELQAADVDVIVAVTHLGFKKMKHEIGRSTSPSDLDLVQAHPGIDVVIGGHSHTFLDEQEIRDHHKRTGTIITQSGSSGKYVGRVTLSIDDQQHAITRFDVEQVRITDKLPEHSASAEFLKEQYAQYMPHAKAIVGRFDSPMQFHNLAFWYADFIRTHADVDICLLPRKVLYDEHELFGEGEVDVERLLGYLHDRYIIKSNVTGTSLLKFCEAEPMRDRFNPFHHQGRPFSGNAMFYSGFTAAFDGETQKVRFGIDPRKTYTLATPWPFGRHRHQLPPRTNAEDAKPVPGLDVADTRVLHQTTRQILTQKGTTDGLEFYVKYLEPLPDWGPWREHFETKLSGERLNP
jgi:5'-nucleotidase